MKTYTITLHDTDNCGSSLQAFALQHFLSKNGIENELIDYTPSYTRDNGNRLKYILRRLVYFKSSYIKEKKFKEFKKKFLHTTNENYKFYQQLVDANLSADCFITGSDQLWNDSYLCGKDPAYYLAFTDKRKIAYAVSIGKRKVSGDSVDRLCRNVQGYSWISVREKSSVGLLSEIVDNNVDFVCDPVFLNSAEEYGVIEGRGSYSWPYILVYVAQDIDRDYVNQIIECAKMHYAGAKVLSIGAYRSKCDCDIQLRTTAPGEFLSLIKNAVFVISNSFHATAFSIIYKKQFATIIPEQNGERIASILEVAKLQENGLIRAVGLPYISEERYKLATQYIEEFSEKSKKILLQELGKIENGGNERDNK